MGLKDNLRNIIKQGMIKKNKYLNSIIYKISSFSRPDLFYVGSTYNSLKKRFSRHKSDFRAFNVGKSKTYLSSFEIIKLGDYHIDLIENFPCENRIQLHARETYFIKTMVCVNKNVSYLTEEERKEEKMKCNKQYKKIKYACDCGVNLNKYHNYKHIKTKKHQAYLKSLEPANNIPELIPS